MNKISIEDLEKIILPILKIDCLSKNVSKQNTQSWDSLAHINIITAIEDGYKIEFDIEEVVTLDTINSILIKLNDKLN